MTPEQERQVLAVAANLANIFNVLQGVIIDVDFEPQLPPLPAPINLADLWEEGKVLRVLLRDGSVTDIESRLSPVRLERQWQCVEYTSRLFTPDGRCHNISLKHSPMCDIVGVYETCTQTALKE